MWSLFLLHLSRYYRDNFLDNNREIIFLISPNPSSNMTLLTLNYLLDRDDGRWSTKEVESALQVSGRW